MRFVTNPVVYVYRNTKYFDGFDNFCPQHVGNNKPERSGVFSHLVSVV